MRFKTELFVNGHDTFVTVDFIYQGKNLVVDILTDLGESVPLGTLSGPEQQNLLDEIGEWQRKVEKYREGAYAFKAPPVNHNKWFESEWVRYIDKHGQWLDE